MGLPEHENRLVRGRTLRLLRLVYPKPYPADGLTPMLASCGHELSIEQLLGVLQYLEDKGYVETHVSSVEGVGRVTTARLTAKGVDLLEHSIEDPGVDL